MLQIYKPTKEMSYFTLKMNSRKKSQEFSMGFAPGVRQYEPEVPCTQSPWP